VDRLLCDIPQIFQNRQPIHLGHLDIDDEDVGLIFTGLDHGLQAAGGGFNIEAHRGASGGDGPENTGVVVGNEYLWSCPV
jgi:hypothetical protein